MTAPRPLPSFLGLSEEEASYPEARVAVLPVPYGGTVSYGGGTESGPAAILEASAQVELFDEETRRTVWALGIATLPPVDPPRPGPDAVVEETHRRTTRILADGKLPLVLGGEHSVSEGPVAACAACHPGLTVLQLDAHSDLREEYQGHRRSHACTGARLREHARLVQVGIRSQCAEERAVIDAGEVTAIFAHEMQHPGWEARLLEALPAGKPLYITVDLDYFDTAIMPATGTPEPGGGQWWPTLRLLRQVLERCRLVGLDLTELAPISGFHAPDYLAARLAYKLLTYGLADEAPPADPEP